MKGIKLSKFIFAVLLIACSTISAANSIVFNGTQVWGNEGAGDGTYYHDFTNITRFTFEVTQDTYINISITPHFPSHAAHFDPSYALFFEQVEYASDRVDPFSLLTPGEYILGVTSGYANTDEYIEGGATNFGVNGWEQYILNDVGYQVIVQGGVAHVYEPAALSLLVYGLLGLAMSRKKKLTTV